MRNKVLQHYLLIIALTAFWVQPCIVLGQDNNTTKLQNGSSSYTIPFSSASSSLRANIPPQNIKPQKNPEEPEPCRPPVELTCNFGYYYVHLDWLPPDGQEVDEWIHYDDGINYDAIGLTDGGTFEVAIRFEPDQLEPYEGSVISEVKMFPGENIYAAELVLKIWEGANATTLLLEQPLDDLDVGVWNTITLTSPVPIDITQELWIGYACNNTVIGEYPAGCDIGPAVAGYGDMITLD